MSDKILPKIKNAEGVFGDQKEQSQIVKSRKEVKEITTLIDGFIAAEKELTPKIKRKSLKKRVDEVTKEYVLESLDIHKGNITAVAKDCAMARSFLYKEMRRFKIDHTKFGSGLKNPRRKKKSKKG